jgi:ubiquinone/menaquinone biosynthesis C-methylase UbiE
MDGTAATVLATSMRRQQDLQDFQDEARSVEFAHVLGASTRRWYDRQASIIEGHAPGVNRILDLGSGPGHLLAQLSRRYPSASIVGVDISAPMVRLAGARVRGSAVMLLQASFYKLPFGDESFDLVTGTGILHHADDLRGLLREARRLLTPGGHFVAIGFRRDAPAWVSLLARMHSTWKSLTGSRLEGLFPVLRASWTRTEVEEALADSGFGRYVVATQFARLTAVAHA